MAGMVIVNNPGDWSTVYAPLLHADWHGWTPTDLIFPAFLFIIGASMAQTAPARQTPAAVLAPRRGAHRARAVPVGFPVLQPRALARPGRAAAHRPLLRGGGRGLARARRARRRRRATTRRLVAAIALLPARLLGAPDARRAAGRPGRRSDGRGQSRRVARPRLFGTHLWRTTWDPEGLLSSLPAVGTTLMGVVAGLWIAAARPGSRGAGRSWPRVLAASSSACCGTSSSRSTSPCGPVPTRSSPAAWPCSRSACCIGRLDDGRSTSVLDRLSEPFVAPGPQRPAAVRPVGSGRQVVAPAEVAAADGTARLLQHWLYRTAFAPLAAPKLASLTLRGGESDGALRAARVAASATMVLERMTHGTEQAIGGGGGGRRVRRVDRAQAGARRLACHARRRLRAGERARQFVRPLARDSCRLRRARHLHALGHRRARRLAVAGQEDWANRWSKNAARSSSASPAAPTCARRPRRSRPAA